MENSEEYEQIRNKLECQRKKRDELVEIRDAINMVIESEDERIEEASQQLFIHSELESPDKIRNIEAQNSIEIVRELEEHAGERIQAELLQSALVINGFQESEIERLRNRGVIYEPEEGMFATIL